MFNNVKFTAIGTKAVSDKYAGSYGELTFSWEDQVLRVHDGKTCGGVPIQQPVSAATQIEYVGAAGALKITEPSGVVSNYYPDVNRILSTFVAEETVVVDSTTPIDTVLMKTAPRVVHTFGDPRNAVIDILYSVITNGITGVVTIQPQYSIDAGVTWTSITYGGSDQFGISGASSTGVSVRELTQVENWTLANVASGTSIEYRLVVAGNSLTAGNMVLQASNAWTTTYYMRRAIVT